ncbi:hypothetical protein [Ruminococcus sp.]|uniref:hypothetical protein n=1 Tax=Ruminococcus sp. TaxID=41978 RepID=UPI0038911738
MKKFIFLLTVALMLCSLAACAGNTNSQTASSAASDTASSVTDTASDPTQAASAADSNTADAPKTDGVDVDLTTMSSTMVYSEVLNMQQAPEQYLGKTVKMKGPFNVSEMGGNRYFACLIKDATACCSTGIEFELAGNYSYPDDYPKKDTEITVIGTFTTYMEGNSKYLQLKNAQLV